MKITDIELQLNQLNAATSTKKPKRAAAAPAAKTNGVTHFSQDELLAITVQRIVAALHLDAQGVTAEILTAQVKAYEQPFKGIVQ